MKKVVIEIGGQRHRLVEDPIDIPDDGICKDCSLYSVCSTPFGICWSIQQENCHFKKEEEVCG